MKKAITIILTLAMLLSLGLSAVASGEASDGSSEPEAVEILSETTAFPGGVTLAQDDYYGAPEGFCVLMVVDGQVVSQKAGRYEGDVVFEIMPLTSSSDGAATYATKSVVIKCDDGFAAAEAVVGGKATADALTGASIAADMPHLSIVTVNGGEYRIEDSSFYLCQTGLHTSGGNDFSGDGCAIAATGDSTVTVKNVTIESDGIYRTNLFGGISTHDAYPTYYVLDSAMTANGDPEGSDGAVWVLGLHGQVRTAMFDDYYNNYYYNTVMNSVGWAVLAVDGVGSPAAGDLDALNARYAEDKGYLNDDGTIMTTAEFAKAATGLTDEYLEALAAVDGEETLKALPDLNDNSLFYYAGKNIVIGSDLVVTDPDKGHTGYATYSIGANATVFSGSDIDCTYGAVLSNEYSTVAFVNGTTVNAGKSVLMNFAHRGGVCYVADSTLTAGEMAFALKGTGDGYEEYVGSGASSGFNLMGGPTGTNLYVRNTKIDAPILTAAFDSDDPGDMGSTTIRVKDTIAPKDESYDVTEMNHWTEPILFWNADAGTYKFNEVVNVYFQDCVGETALKGDIYNCHQWTSKNMVLTLDHCELTGLISSGWCEHEVDYIEQSMGPFDEPYTDEDGLVHGNRENMGRITCHASETVNNGVIVTLVNGSVWNVTETSYVSVLNVDETSVVNGTITVLPSGIIMVEPLAGSSVEPSGGPST